MRDRFFRNIDYMRISVTDKCNMFCRYCRRKNSEKENQNAILTHQEILDVVKAAADCGITKLKITGGEPLLRDGIAELVHDLKNISGIQHVSMTTNGVFLSDFIHKLKDAGLDAVNISLDTLKPERFKNLTGTDFFERVLEGIDSALSAKIPTKINTVLQKNINDDEWENILLLAKNKPLFIRFIELMPIGEGKNFTGINNNELLKKIHEKYKIKSDTENHGNGPAVYYRISEFEGGVGFISAMCGKFCASCNRLRLTARGKLKPCLCFAESVNIADILKNKMHTELKNAIKKAVEIKPLEHCFDSEKEISEQNSMAEIGG